MAMENFLENIKNKAKKAAIVGATVLSSFLPVKESAAQTAITQQNTIENSDKSSLKTGDLGTPSNTWKFLEDSLIAENSSKVYPGFIETYLQNSETGEYIFNEDKSGNPINTPDFLQEQINIEKGTLEKYGDAEKWANEQFGYQQTEAFTNEVLQKYIVQMERKISDLNDKFEALKNNPDYSREDHDLDQKDLTTYENSLEYFKNNPEQLVHKESLEQLVQDAKGYVELSKKHIENIQLELNSVLKYIDSNR